MKLFLKGLKCNTEKCPFTQRPFNPGAHGKKPRKKQSYYAMQLREKQKVKRVYGMLERQFKRFFHIAAKTKGVTGRKLIQLLERRLDNLLYRSLMASSRSDARQIVRHGFVFINGRRVDIPSYVVSDNEEIVIKGDDGTIKRLKDNMEANAKERSVPNWLRVDKDNLVIKVITLPVKEDLVIPMNEQLIVELYSK